MKYADHRLKGTIGYIKKQLVFEIIKTLILFVMALGLFFIGYFTLHTKKSLWSVLAVLALLPACRSLVGVIMFARFLPASNNDISDISQGIGDLNAIYENIITTSNRTYYLPVICAGKKSVIAYSAVKSEPELKEHIENVLKNAGYNVTVKIFEQKDAFMNRCTELVQKSDVSEDDVSALQVIETLKAVSL
ncbi:MAG: hypothetical protein K6F87_06305 [Lachnospiraceae bacterium]|nr:hypothetical protein [Lachnospiraceae bacterium]